MGDLLLSSMWKQFQSGGFLTESQCLYYPGKFTVMWCAGEICSGHPPPGATMRWQWNKFLFEDVSPIKKWWFSIVMLLCWRVIFLKVFPGRWLWSNGGCELHGFQGWQYTVLVDSFWLVWGFVYWAYASHRNLHTLVFRSWGLASDCPVLLVLFSNFDSQNIGNLNCLKEA